MKFSVITKDRFSCTLRTGHSARTQILLKLLWFHRTTSSLTLKKCVEDKSFEFFSRKDRSFILYMWMEILTKSMFKVHPKKFSIEKDGSAFWMWQVSLSQMESSNTRNKPFQKNGACQHLSSSKEKLHWLIWKTEKRQFIRYNNKSKYRKDFNPWLVLRSLESNVHYCKHKEDIYLHYFFWPSPLDYMKIVSIFTSGIIFCE